MGLGPGSWIAHDNTRRCHSTSYFSPITYQHTTDSANLQATA